MLLAHGARLEMVDIQLQRAFFDPTRARKQNKKLVAAVAREKDDAARFQRRGVAMNPRAG